MNSTVALQTSRSFGLFCIGFSVVLLSIWFPFLPEWTTFIHIWRVELFASIFLTVVLIVAFFHSRSITLRTFSNEEKLLVIYPMLAFILWSAVSSLWAESWKSSLHHALVWSEYLVFYCLIRNLIDSEDKSTRFTFVLAGVLALYALPAVAGYISVQIFEGSNTLGLRFSRFGEQAVVLLPVLFAITITRWDKYRWLGIASIAFAWLLVLCSMSRTTIFLAVAVTAAVLIALVLSGKVKGNKTAMAATLAVFIAAPFVLNIPSLISQSNSTPVAQRFSDSNGLSDSNGFRKLMIALSLEIIADKPLAGIGADNFGFEVHKYRQTFAAAKPESPLLAYAENEIPERAHNEYLQIAAELGIIGVAIFAWFLVGIAIMAWRSVTRIRQVPVVAVTAVIGIFGFLAAALVTSYSFRLIQNGFFFFFALSLAAKYLLPKKETVESEALSPVLSVRYVCAAGIAVCLLLALYSTTRVASVIVQEQASTTVDGAKAAQLYTTAAWLDSENPIAHKSAGMRAFRDKDFAKAVPLLQRSVEMGESTSTSISYLASAQTLSGDNIGAESTLRHAAHIYPHSVFIQSRFSVVLNANGKPDEASLAFERANSINPKAAETWRTLLTKGAAEVSSQAVTPNSGIIPVMDLAPQSAVYAVMSERLIMHPEEQKFSMFRPYN